MAEPMMFQFTENEVCDMMSILMEVANPCPAYEHDELALAKKVVSMCRSGGERVLGILRERTGIEGIAS